MNLHSAIRHLLFVMLASTALVAQPLLSDANFRIRGMKLQIVPGSPNLVKLIGPSKDQVHSKTLEDIPLAKALIADLTIDVRTLDTSRYSTLFRLMSEVPLGGLDEFVALDADRNGRKEIYGGYLENDMPGSQLKPRVYEFDGGSGFTYRCRYPDSLLGALTWDDLDRDGTVDLIYRASGWIQVISQTDSVSLPQVEKLRYDVGGGPSYMKFFDINGDGRRELIYRLDGRHPGPMITESAGYYVEAYDSSANAFRVIFYTHPQAWQAADYSLGDFDQDGHQNMALGDIEGEFYMVEHQSGNSYAVSHVGKLPVKNAFLTCFTNDMDGNGRPELWMGGDMYVNGVGLTRLMAYEATSNDAYQIAYTIDLPGVFSFFAGNMQAVDMDHDGKEELLLCIDQRVLIFKSRGVRQYELWSAWRNELSAAGENSVVYAAWATDFLQSDYPQILVSMDRIWGPYADRIHYFSRIYKYTGPTTAVQPPPITAAREFSLAQNYPNPFNPTTTIRYSLPLRSRVSLTLFNTLGQQVAVLQNGEQEAGYHEVRLEGSGLASGVYFYRIRAGDFVQTKRLTLLR